MERQSSSAF